MTDLVTGTLLNDRYRLEAELGRGGAGVIYRAHDTLLDRDVAIKALSATTLSAESRVSLLREAQAAARLNHPNIVSVYDIGEIDQADGVPFIVMELVEGEPLHSRPPQTLNEILSIARQVCAALDHAHANGIIHRDLKPENVLIAPDGSARLVDFGLAHTAASRLADNEAIVGTVFYLAPEQALGEEVDGRADLYALGVMLYELTTGQLPHTGNDPLAVISQHLHASVVPPSTHNAAIPLALDALIVQLLSKRPQDRPASVTEVRQTLDDLTLAVQATSATGSLQRGRELVTVPFLETKLHIPPIRPDGQRVPRPRLIERLDAGTRSGCKLTLVSAPAGFGKTTLVSEWIHSRVGGRDYGVGSSKHAGPASSTPYSSLRVPTPRFAWLSLDESDNDPVRFLAYLVGALQTIEANIGKGALSAPHVSQPQPPPTDTIMTALINDVAAVSDRMVLVLDDYHLIDAQPIHDALVFLLQHLPPQMHLVVVTRDDPQLPLARLRARGQLTELRATDLRFTLSEAAAFLNQVMGLDLSTEDIAALETRTEGWIAGLQLAAISMQGRKDMTAFVQSFTGSHHFILDYLIEEVLDQQSESIQTFLLQTAILGRLSGSLCDALTGQEDGRVTLEMLDHGNLFIVPLDEERHWYRYHRLFGDLLRQRLRQAQSKQIPTLHGRASAWYEQHGFADEAIEHALRAESFERAASLIDEHVDAIWKRGEHAKLGRWLAGLPGEWVLSRPQLCVFSAWYLFATGQRDAAERVLQAAEQALGTSTNRATGVTPPAQDQLPGPESMKLRGRLAAIRALMGSWWGDVPGIIQHARQALEYLPKQDPWRGPAAIALGDAYDSKGDVTAAYQARAEAAEACKAAGDLYFCMIANLKLAITLRAQGRLQRTIEICQQQLQLADESGLSQTAVAGCLLAQWGEALAELNDLDRALHRAKKGVELTEGGDLALLGFSNLCLTRVLFSRGELDGAEEIVDKLENVARQHDLPPYVTGPTAAWRATIWLAQGKLEAASQWARERALDPDTESPLEHKVEYVVLARVLLAQGALDEATRLLQRLLEAAEAGERTASVIEILAFQALASQAGGEPTQAMAALERALALAKPEGSIRIFVDQGPPMARLLYEAVSRGIAPDYARRLLAEFPVAKPEQAAQSGTQASDPELIEPLSERELEVLRLIAKGLTNREIASRLFLALNTVKAHSRNIYGKLGVHSRTQAVARARALGLLPST